MTRKKCNKCGKEITTTVIVDTAIQERIAEFHTIDKPYTTDTCFECIIDKIDASGIGTILISDPDKHDVRTVYEYAALCAVNKFQEETGYFVKWPLMSGSLICIKDFDAQIQEGDIVDIVFTRSFSNELDIKTQTGNRVINIPYNKIVTHFIHKNTEYTNKKQGKSIATCYEKYRVLLDNLGEYRYMIMPINF